MQALMVVTCEIRHWNYFSRWKSSEITSKLFQWHRTCWKIFM